MKCDKCLNELEEGYVFSSKDGIIGYGQKVPGVFENTKNKEDIILLSKPILGRRSYVKAYYCKTCERVIIECL